MKEILVSPTRRIGIMIGRMLGGATTGLFQGLLVLVLCLFVGIDFSTVISLPLAVLFMVVLSFLFTSFGIIIASLLPDFQGFQLIMNFLIMPLMFLSGAMFPLATTPVWLQMIARFDPLSYAVDGIRRALTGNSFFTPWMDGVVLLALMFLFVLLGGYFFSRMKADD
jgi:ABC-2 type transport system permease protein